MNALKPHSDNLQDLSIGSFGGKVFPNWIGNPSFLLLTCVRIKVCRKCTFLPPLGQLPSLKKLYIQSLNEVKVVGAEFLGTGIAFPKLESLRFEDMSGWEVWSTNSGGVDAVFPHLQTLAIEDLDLSVCGDGVLTSLIHAASAVTKLSIWRISGLSDEVWRGVMDYLGEVEEVSIHDCNEIRYLWESEAKAKSFPAADLPNLTSLTHLTIVNCKSMIVDSFGLWPPKLGFLEIGRLKKPILKLGPQNFPPSLVHLRLWGGSAEEDDVSSGSQLSHMLPSSLTKLDLWYFGKLKSVSMGLQHLTTLQHLVISSCRKIQDLPETLLPSLLTLRIWWCPDNLKEKISRKGSYWPLVSYIPSMYIS
nr:NB-ARC domains-containing protein [Tanacetum cinerariifolium]